MRQAIDKALLFIIGCANQAVFSATGGRVVLYHFGLPGVLLITTGPDMSIGQTMIVGYLPDGDDYILMATEAQSGLLAALRAAETVRLAKGQIPVDIAMLTDRIEGAALLNRLLKQASIHERHMVTRRREVPVARLTPHYKPRTDGSVAVCEIR